MLNRMDQRNKKHWECIGTTDLYIPGSQCQTGSIIETRNIENVSEQQIFIYLRVNVKQDEWEEPEALECLWTTDLYITGSQYYTGWIRGSRNMGNFLGERGLCILGSQCYIGWNRGTRNIENFSEKQIFIYIGVSVTRDGSEESEMWRISLRNISLCT